MGALVAGRDLKEDGSRVRSGYGAITLASLRRLVLHLVKSEDSRKRQTANRDRGQMLKVIGI